MTDAKRPKARREKGHGSIFKPKGSRYYWIAYWVGGKRHYEVVRNAAGEKSTNIADARDRLEDIRSDKRKGIAVSPKLNAIKLATALKAVVDDQRLRGKKSADQTQQRIDNRLLPYFGPDHLLASITTGDVERYQAHRITEEKAKPATVNREMAILRRAFRLAHRRREVTLVPYVPMIEENNVREGFLEREHLDAILKHLPAWMHPPLEFMFVTGWRKSEVFSLTAGQVDIAAGTVRLDGSATKSGKPRLLVLTPDLVALIMKQLASIEELKSRDVICPWVFHRPDGSQIAPRKLWESAREEAGYPTALLHDFRRSAVRNLGRAGVPRTTAMKITGHVTESVYKRYDIQDEAVLREAAEKMQAFADAQRTSAARKTAGGQVRRFRGRKG